MEATELVQSLQDQCFVLPVPTEWSRKRNTDIGTSAVAATIFDVGQVRQSGELDAADVGQQRTKLDHFERQLASQMNGTAWTQDAGSEFRMFERFGVQLDADSLQVRHIDAKEPVANLVDDFGVETSEASFHVGETL
jgi:hypothetical protein